MFIAIGKEYIFNSKDISTISLGYSGILVRTLSDKNYIIDGEGKTAGEKRKNAQEMYENTMNILCNQNHD